MNRKDFNYKRLHPFKWFILENYPFLEDSIDTLTNYQLFCKLGEMINKEIDTINILGKQVEDITDWFDNLDLQEEVNKKLDEMAEDGSLAAIINQEIFGQINEDINTLKNDVDDININLQTKTNNTLEYMWTHHTNLTGFQALCCDNTSYYYYEGNTNNLYKRNLSDNELTNTYNIPSFEHGNDMTIIDGVIYNANFTDKNINTYELSSGNIDIINCLNDVSSYGIISGITKYDDTHLLVVMAPSGAGSTTKISDCGLYKVDIVNNIYTPLNLDSNNMYLTSTSVIQSIEYVDGNLYFLTSQPSMITQFVEDGTDFKCSNIFDFHDYDINGLPYGEMEGIALLPNSFNGKGTMLVYSQMKDFGTDKTLKFYCFNPMVRLPLVRYPIHQDSSAVPTELTQMYVNAGATGYYEIGSSSYPFKNLIDAIHSFNFGQYLKFRQIQITGAGTYTLGNLRNLKAYIFSSVASVVINMTLSDASSDLHIESTDDTKRMTINISTGYVNNSKIHLINNDVNITSTAAITFNNSTIVIDKCAFSVAGLLAFEGCFATMHFRSYETTRADGKFFNIDRDNFVVFNCADSVIPANTITKGASLVARYNSIVFA